MRNNLSSAAVAPDNKDQQPYKPEVESEEVNAKDEDKGPNDEFHDDVVLLPAKMIGLHSRIE